MWERRQREGEVRAVSYTHLDKKNVKLWIMAVILAGAILFGFLFSFLEHSMPMREMKRQAQNLKNGQIDVLQLPRFRGGYRPIASDINVGIQRVVEKGGGTARKPADLESILGPVPAQPNMSAFSFPLPDGSAPPQQIPQVPPAPGSFSGPPPPNPNTATNQGANPRFPGAPPPPNSRPGGPPPPTNQAPAFAQSDRTMAMPGAPPPTGGYPHAPPPAAGAPPGPSHSATVAASPGGAAKLGIAQTAPAPFPTPAPMVPKKLGENEDEQTMVAQPSADLISAASGAHLAATDPAAEWPQVYDCLLYTSRCV